MRRRVFYSFLIAALLSIAAPAQQGHPLSGTWTGDWGSTPTQRNQVTLVMNWDGKNVTGLINPGPDSVPLSSVYVDVTDWTVRIEAEAKTGHISAEGRIEDLGSYHRKIRGTWKQGNVTGDFRLTRD
jgi:hypothetical protein